LPESLFSKDKAVNLLARQRAKVGDKGLSDFFVRWMSPERLPFISV